MTVLWSNPAEHFHVTQVAIRGVDPVRDVDPIGGVDPIAILSCLASFSQLHVLRLAVATPEIVAEIGKHLPKCKIEVG